MPRPGRAIWVLMIALGVIGVGTAALYTWGEGAEKIFVWLAYIPAQGFAQPWRFLTSSLLTDPEGMMHLAAAIVTLFFLGTPMAKKWGTWRFVRFVVISAILGNVVTWLVAIGIPASAPGKFHPSMVFGPDAFVTALVVAWSRDYGDDIVNFFMVLPMKGRTLFWFTLAFCVLRLIYPGNIEEGVVSPFGGVIAALLFGDTPSLARTAWLRLRLALLRRQSTSLRVDDILARKPPRRAPRPGSPPLRVVSGGLEEVLKKRTPPKDKRYLN
jgi:membrane associated rhomboid family serine protease